MGLHVERVPTLGDNYTYVIVCEDTGEAAVIDAPETDPVLKRLEGMDARVTKAPTFHSRNSRPVWLGPFSKPRI